MINLTNDFSISKLFVTKKIKIIVDNKDSFYIQLRNIKDFYENDIWNSVYTIWKMDSQLINKNFGLSLNNSYDFILLILFKLGYYVEYESIRKNFLNILKEIIPGIEIDNKNQQLKVKNVIINAEIWNYIIYILKLSYGEKVDHPLYFENDEMKKFYMAQKENEERIRKLRANQKADPDWLAKILLYIIYAFPSLTIEYLLDQTMAQIQWLYQKAAGSVSYQVNAQAFAAGNMKKGSKLDFFIK